MKHLAIGLLTTVALGFGQAALAADMSLKAPPMAPPPPSWTGLYIGGNVGVDWTNSAGTWSPLPDPTTFGALDQTGGTGGNAVLGGIQGGYNWQFAPTWVAGIEADMSWTATHGGFNNPWMVPAIGMAPGSFTQMSTNLDWLSSVRARLGFLVVPSVMVYGTAGGAWGKIGYAASNANGAGTYATNTAFSNTVGGWVAGGGIEWMMNAHWLLRWEYLHYGFSNSPSVTTFDTTGHFPTTFPSGYSWTKTNVDVVRWALSYKFGAGSASAADMPVKVSLYKAPPAPACIWCGWYAGINTGYVNSRNSFSTVSSPTPDPVLGVVPGVSEGLAALSTGSIPFETNGGLGLVGGAQAGYNWQTHDVLAGIEADIQGFSQGRSATTNNAAVVVGVPVASMQTATMSTSFIGTLRGRLGLFVTPTWLAYATGGLAYGGVKASDTLFQTGTNGFIGAGSGTLSDTRTGWALGGGTEWMFATRWSVKAEYFHYDLGTVSVPNTPASAFFLSAVYQTNVSSAHFQGDVVRAGINYHF